MTTVLLTGATGFVGRSLARALSGQVHLICLVHGDEPAGALDADVVRVELANPGFSRALPARVDTVVHLAVCPPSLNPSALEMFRVNVIATLELLEYARANQAGRFVYASSGSVYRHCREPLTERQAFAPDSTLGISKYTSELLMPCLAGSCVGIALRLFHVYGPGQPRHFLLPRLADMMATGRPIIVNSEGGPRISVTYIADVVAVLEAAMKFNESLIMNVAHPEPTSVLELATVIGELLSMAPNVERRDANDVSDLIADVSTLQKQLGWLPRTPLHDGLAQTFRSVDDRGASVGGHKRRLGN